MSFNPAKAAELFRLQENIVPVALLPIGYPADDAKPADIHYIRAAIDDLLL